jgi:hypothetical protein
MRYGEVRPGNSVVSSTLCRATVTVATSGAGAAGVWTWRLQAVMDNPQHRAIRTAFDMKEK